MSRCPEIVVFGSCMIDLICYCTRLPKPGETLHGTDFKYGHGGKGANQCVAASNLGASAALIARLGNDDFGIAYKKQLSSIGINTDHVHLTDGRSCGMAQITVSESGENVIVIVSGANEMLSIDDAKKAESLLINSKVVIFQFETPINSTIKTLELIKREGGPVTILNGAPAMPNIEHKIYKLCDVFCVNETEAAEMTGLSVNSIQEACLAIEKFQSFGCKTVIITLGKEGAIYSEINSKPSHISPPHVANVVDTTGAGDAFIGALAFFTAAFPNMSLATRIYRSCAVATVSTMSKGTQTSFPLKKDLDSGLFVDED